MFLPIKPESATILPRYESAWVDNVVLQHADIGRVHFTGLVLAAVCYILYTISFVVAAYLQRKRQLRSPTQWSVLFGLFLFSSTQFSIQAVEAWLALVRSEDPTDVFGSPTNQFLPAKSMILALSAIVTHVVMLERLLHYWSHNRIVMVVPMLLVLAGSVGWLTVTGYEIKEVVVQLTDPYSHLVNVWSMATYAIILTCNLVVSILITSRIIWVSQNAVPERPTKLSLAINVFVQGGWLYTFGMLMIIFAYALGAKDSSTVLYYIIPYIIAAVPTFIILTRIPPPKSAPVPGLIKPKKKKIMDGLSLRCAGLDEEDLDEITLDSGKEMTSMSQAASIPPVPRRPERPEYV